MNKERDLDGWAEGERHNVLEVAGMLGVSPEAYRAEPANLVPALQDYVSRAPFEEFEQSDRITMHADLMSYVADYLIRKHGARWSVDSDSTTPCGYRYVVEAVGRDGRTRQLDPLQTVAQEFAHPPVDIVRMLAGAELTLGLLSPALPATHSAPGPPTTR
ncbi:hypothetical protein [Streptomyces sp. SID4982]|uniref:hypothetical protein n=1 Tax=Streptomyces sp. SID4982 TaxID=2690291 RepID=UPI00137094D9|nr:hypothetical protein [Streptomyces sp. SID4982]MYS12349.1 hypothetical protein [Streptomyces sp. SID4982]